MRLTGSCMIVALLTFMGCSDINKTGSPDNGDSNTDGSVLHDGVNPDCEPTGGEICDGLDNDCDGLVDNDGACIETGTECVDGIDNDLDGLTDAYDPDCPPYLDRDGDGYAGLIDCNDLDPSVHPGAEELCNGDDDDCDGSVD